MTHEERSLDVLRRHIAMADIAPFVPISLERRRRSGFPSTTPWALIAILVAAPAVAAVYSRYATDNATVRALAVSLSKTTGKALQADLIVSNKAPQAERAFSLQGFHVVRAATFQSGATSVELATDRGPVVVVVSHKSSHSVMLTPQGSDARFYSSGHDAFRHGPIARGFIVEAEAGPYTINVNSERIVPKNELGRILAAARPH